MRELDEIDDVDINVADKIDDFLGFGSSNDNSKISVDKGSKHRKHRKHHHHHHKTRLLQRDYEQLSELSDEEGATVKKNENDTVNIKKQLDDVHDEKSDNSDFSDEEESTDYTALSFKNKKSSHRDISNTINGNKVLDFTKAKPEARKKKGAKRDKNSKKSESDSEQQNSENDDSKERQNLFMPKIPEGAKCGLSFFGLKSASDPIVPLWCNNDDVIKDKSNIIKPKVPVEIQHIEDFLKLHKEYTEKIQEFKKLGIPIRIRNAISAYEKELQKQGVLEALKNFNPSLDYTDEDLPKLFLTEDDKKKIEQIEQQKKLGLFDKKDTISTNPQAIVSKFGGEYNPDTLSTNDLKIHGITPQALLRGETTIPTLTLDEIEYKPVSVVYTEKSTNKDGKPITKRKTEYRAYYKSNGKLHESFMITYGGAKQSELLEFVKTGQIKAVDIANIIMSVFNKDNIAAFKSIDISRFSRRFIIELAMVKRYATSGEKKRLCDVLSSKYSQYLRGIKFSCRSDHPTEYDYSTFMVTGIQREFAENEVGVSNLITSTLDEQLPANVIMPKQGTAFIRYPTRSHAMNVCNKMVKEGFTAKMVIEGNSHLITLNLDDELDNQEF